MTLAAICTRKYGLNHGCMIHLMNKYIFITKKANTTNCTSKLPFPAWLQLEENHETPGASQETEDV